MTVIAAFQGNGFSVMASDSRASDISNGDMFVLANKKITRDKQDQYLFAASGASRGANLLQQGWTPPDAPAYIDEEHLDEFMTQTFISSLRELFVDEGYEGISFSGESAVHDSVFLVSVHGVIYPIFQDYCWDRDVRGVYAIGSGGPIAIGVMEALGIQKCKNKPEEARKIVKKAVEIACEWNAFCALPVHIEIQYKD